MTNFLSSIFWVCVGSLLVLIPYNIVFFYFARRKNKVPKVYLFHCSFCHRKDCRRYSTNPYDKFICDGKRK